jgi:hypothetical protein
MLSASETSVSYYTTIRCHIAEVNNLRSHRDEKLRSQLMCKANTVHRRILRKSFHFNHPEKAINSYVTQLLFIINYCRPSNEGT